jgi:hypothetical protein
VSAQDLIDEAKRIRQRLRYPPNAVHDPGIDLTRKSTAHKGSEPVPDPPVRKVLADPVPEPSYPPLDVKFPITFDDILDAVSIHYGVSVGALKGASRRAHTCFARFVVVYLSLRLLARRSLSSIARDLDKDHTSILHARNRINAIIAGNPAVASEVLMIEAYIAANHRSAVSTIGQCSMALQSRPGPSGQEILSLGG